MAKQPLLSVILVFRNQKDLIEPALTALYEMNNIPIELVVVDEGSTDGSGEVISSLMEHYQHSDSYFFQHEHPVGKGNALNEALQEVAGSYLWLPQQPEKIHEEVLAEHLKKLRESDKRALYQHTEPLPEYGDIDGWIKMMDREALPEDELFLWNWQQLPPYQRFFNPFLSNHHGCELAMRTLDRERTALINPFYHNQQAGSANKADYATISEFVFTLLRRSTLHPEQKDLLLQLLNPTITEPLGERKHNEENEKLKRALSFYKAGNTLAALDLSNEILEQDQDHVEAKKLKVDVLEKLRRYVEAAELKHQIRNMGTRKSGEQAVSQPQGGGQGPVMEPAAEENGDEAKALPKDQKTSAEEGQQQQPLESMQMEQEEPEPETEAEAHASADRGSSATAEAESEHRQELEEKPAVEEEYDGILTSIIVPTTADCKPLLENLLVSLDENSSPENRELIVVDNASLDETHAYLDQLEQSNFFNIKRISRPTNSGFSASVNAALERAEGKYAFILHNDVVMPEYGIEEMERLMEENSEYGLIGPVSPNTINQKQESDTARQDIALEQVEYVDSFCMIYRTSLGLRFDERFSPAYYDDVDFSFQIQQQGSKVGIAPNVVVDHLFGETTAALTLDTGGNLYWRNAKRFNEKWEITHHLPDEFDELAPIEKLLRIQQIVNPFYPEENLQEAFQRSLDDEMRTLIMRVDYESDVLFALVDLMITMDQRDILRKLEDRLENFELPLNLIRRLIDYYYDKNIYSRCKHYLSVMKDQDFGPYFGIIDLKIQVEEKELDHAVERLNELMEDKPFNVDVYRMAGEIHKLDGNTEEANQFFEMVEQIWPKSLNVYH